MILQFENDTAFQAKIVRRYLKEVSCKLNVIAAALSDNGDENMASVVRSSVCRVNDAADFLENCLVELEEEVD